MTAINRARYPLLKSAIEAVVDFFVRSARRYKATQELRNIGENEVSVIARDLGVSQTELKALVKRDAGFPPLLKNLLSALQINGLALQETNPILLRDMQKVCAFCQNTRRCREELQAGSAEEHFHDYCPNSPNLYEASIFRSLPERQEHTRAAN
jgi:hypothetical protein